MGDISGMSFEQVKAQLGDSYRTIQQNPGATDDDMIQSLMGVKATFVTTSPVTLATLLATYPAGAGNLGKYARVSDLWGSVNTLLVCEGDVSGYYWRPQRTDYASNMTVAQGGVNLIPLLTQPVLRMVGSITGNITLTPSTQNVWPGATFDVTVKTVIPALLSVNISGLVGGNTLPLLQGSRKRLTYYAGLGWDSE